MDVGAATSANWCLAHFPCEVLSNLTSRLGCSDVLNLWKSGNARLRALLTVQGGVRQFRLISRARRNIVVPAFLYELTHLEHLSLHVILDDEIEVKGFDPFRLPSGLISLDLVCEDLVSLFLPSDAPSRSWKHIVPIAPHLSRLECLSLYGNLVAFNDNHRIFFCPSLTRLRLTTTRILHENLGSCPVNLTELYVDDIHHTPPTESTKFPPNLIRLRAPVYISKDPLVLPSGLESLDCIISASQKGTLPPLLPVSLKTLIFNVNVNVRFGDETVRSFPRGLTDLDLLYVEQLPSSNLKWLEELPLTRLVLPAGSQLSDELVRYLPRTLLRLDANYQSDLTEALVAHLPPHLTELLISLVALVRDDVVAALPRSLKRLSMLCCQFSQVEYLPQNLEVLKLTNALLVAQERPAKLPLALRTFSCDMMPEFHPTWLPKWLRALDIAADDINDTMAPHFPPQLTFLSIRGGDISDAFLTHLSTPFLTAFSFVSSTEQHSALTDAGLAKLPPSLRSLHLKGHSITSACAIHLPRALTVLSLDQSKIWEDKDIEFLPRGLKELTLPVCDTLTYDCIPMLPPQLLRFYMNGYPGFTQVYNDLKVHPEIWQPK